MDFEEKIRKIAYDLYEKNGRREGHDLFNWLAAEQIFRFERMIFPEASDREGQPARIQTLVRSTLRAEATGKVSKPLPQRVGKQTTPERGMKLIEVPAASI